MSSGEPVITLLHELCCNGIAKVHLARCDRLLFLSYLPGNRVIEVLLDRGVELHHSTVGGALPIRKALTPHLGLDPALRGCQFAEWRDIVEAGDCGEDGRLFTFWRLGGLRKITKKVGCTRFRLARCQGQRTIGIDRIDGAPRLRVCRSATAIGSLTVRGAMLRVRAGA